MNVVGYVREAPGRGQSETAFAQGERIRRWALDTGNHLIATCQDHGSGAPDARPGYQALLDVVRAGRADAVIVADLDALSPDKVLQEIMLVDLRAGGATIIATTDEDLALLADASADHTRLVVRDIVAKVTEYEATFGLSSAPAATDGSTGATPEPVDDLEDEDGHNVVVELIAPTG